MKKALVLGGTHDHIRLIQLLKEKGYWVILLDYYEQPVAKVFADRHIQLSTTSKDIVLEFAKNEQVSLVISTSIDSALVTSAFVAEQLKLPYYISFETSLRVTSKPQMKEMFLRLNIPSAQHISLYPQADYSKLQDLSFPLVVKPADANSSKGVAKVEAGGDLMGAIETARGFSATSTVIVEEFVQGRELSVDLMIVKGEPFVIMVSESEKSILNTDKFTITQSNFPVEISDTVIIEICRITRNIVHDLAYMNGPFLIQLIENQGKVNVVEFSTRLGGGSKHHFILTSIGYDILNSFIDLVIHGRLEEPQISATTDSASMVYLYAKEGRFSAISGYEELCTKGVIKEFFRYMEFGTKINGNTTSSDRPCGFLVLGKDYFDVSSKIQLAKSMITILDENGERINL